MLWLSALLQAGAAAAPAPCCPSPVCTAPHLPGLAASGVSQAVTSPQAAVTNIPCSREGWTPRPWADGPLVAHLPGGRMGKCMVMSPWKAGLGLCFGVAGHGVLVLPSAAPPPPLQPTSSR